MKSWSVKIIVPEQEFNYFTNADDEDSALQALIPEITENLKMQITIDEQKEQTDEPKA